MNPQKVISLWPYAVALVAVLAWTQGLCWVLWYVAPAVPGAVIFLVVWRYARRLADDVARRGPRE